MPTDTLCAVRYYDQIRDQRIQYMGRVCLCKLLEIFLVRSQDWPTLRRVWQRIFPRIWLGRNMTRVTSPDCLLPDHMDTDWSHYVCNFLLMRYIRMKFCCRSVPSFRLHLSIQSRRKWKRITGKKKMLLLLLILCPTVWRIGGPKMKYFSLLPFIRRHCRHQYYSLSLLYSITVHIWTLQ